MRIEDEFKGIDTTGEWGRLFQQIKTESSNYDYSFRDAKKTENKNLNRYRDVSPWSIAAYNRPFLADGMGTEFASGSYAE